MLHSVCEFMYINIFAHFIMFGSFDCRFELCTYYIHMVYNIYTHDMCMYIYMYVCTYERTYVGKYVCIYNV